MFNWLKSANKKNDDTYTGRHRTAEGELSTMEQTAQKITERISVSSGNQTIVVPAQKPVPVIPVYATAEDHEEVTAVEPYNAAHRAREDYAPTKPVGTASIASVDISGSS